MRPLYTPILLSSSPNKAIREPVEMCLLKSHYFSPTFVPSKWYIYPKSANSFQLQICFTIKPLLTPFLNLFFDKDCTFTFLQKVWSCIIINAMLLDSSFKRTYISLTWGGSSPSTLLDYSRQQSLEESFNCIFEESFNCILFEIELEPDCKLLFLLKV